MYAEQATIQDILDDRERIGMYCLHRKDSLKFKLHYMCVVRRDLIRLGLTDQGSSYLKSLSHFIQVVQSNSILKLKNQD